LKLGVEIDRPLEVICLALRYKLAEHVADGKLSIPAVVKEVECIFHLPLPLLLRLSLEVIHQHGVVNLVVSSDLIKYKLEVLLLQYGENRLQNLSVDVMRLLAICKFQLQGQGEQTAECIALDCLLDQI
jgi:hypothetical protein